MNFDTKSWVHRVDMLPEVGNPIIDEAKKIDTKICIILNMIKDLEKDKEELANEIKENWSEVERQSANFSF